MDLEIEVGCPHRRISAIAGFLRKRIGNIGSFGVLYVTHVSYSPKAKKRAIPVVRVLMMAPLLQA